MHNTAHRGPVERRRFEDQYRRWYRPTVRLCQRLLGPGHDAEAVAQEVFARAWTSFDRFADDRPFWPWVATNARRVCINESVAKSRRDRRFERTASMFTTEASNVDDVEQAVAADAVDRVLRRLSPRERRLLVLRDLDGWTYDEIARLEGASIESVRGALKRARAAFRRKYEGTLGAAGGLAAAVRRGARTAERWASLVGGRSGGSEALAIAAAAAFLLAPGAPSDVVHDRAPMPVAVGIGASDPTTSTSVSGSMSSTARGLAGGNAASAAFGRADPEAVAAKPGDGWGYRFTSSPDYEDDRTVFASGQAMACGMRSAENCALLLKSTDGGRTWARLAADDRPAGDILLPPAYPADPRLFSVSEAALSVSEDDGESFRAVTPISGRATMSPLFSAGDPRILFGATTGHPVAMQYDDRDGSITPLPLALPPGVSPVHLAFSPGYDRDRRILVGAVEVGGGTGSVGLPSGLHRAVYACGAGGCDRVLGAGAGSDAPEVIAIPGAGGMVLVWTADGLYRSFDAGRSFDQVPRPGTHPERVVREAVASESGKLFVTLSMGNVGDTWLYVSDDSGESWTWQRDLTWLFSDLVVLPDGTQLSGRPLTAGGGIACSTDDGRTWANQCKADDGQTS